MFGLRPVAGGGDSDYTAQQLQAVIPATDATGAVFAGDPVVLAGDADAASKLPTIAKAAAGARIFGVVVGFVPEQVGREPRYRENSTRRQAFVADVGQGKIFEVTASAALTSAMVGQLFDLTAPAGDTVRERSNAVLDVATAGTASGQVQLMGIANSPDNDFGTDTIALVRVNESTHTSEASGV